jgi:hypothetical protein
MFFKANLKLKNILNILLFFFLTTFLNAWSLQGCPPDYLCASTIELIENEEKEREEHVRNELAGCEKTKLKGAGGTDIDDEFNPSVPELHQSTPVFYLFSRDIFVSCAETGALKQYRQQLLNSFFIPKLFLLFHCFKAFLL